MRRILYVGMKADYGDESRGLSFEESNFHHPLRHQSDVAVEHFDFMAIFKQVGQERMSEELLAKVRAYRPHLLFFVGFNDECDPSREVMLRITTETDTATLLWSCDDHWRFDDYTSHWAPVLDWVATTDRNALPKYRALGYGHKVILSQWAVNHRLYAPTYGGPISQVSFVGQPHGDRARILEGLLAQKVPVEVFGFGWREGIRRLSLEEMVTVFSRSRINLNLGNSSVPGSQQIKGRNFEVPGCHGFLLTQPVPYLEDYFEPGREIAIFTDEDDLLRQIDYYLRNEGERRAVAARGYARCLMEHTWDHRFQAIFAHIGLSRAHCKVTA